MVRNQLKRRLRAIVAGRVASLPAGSYVIRAAPGGALLEFDDLSVAVNQALERATSERTRRSPDPAPPYGRVIG